MLVTTLACTVAAMLFLAAMLYATVSDLRRKRIPNWLIIALAVAYLPLALTAGYAPLQIAIDTGVAALVFAAGLFCFAKGWIGGGDVKLAAVSAMWLGAGLAMPYVILTALFGGAFTLATLLGLRLLARAGQSGTTVREGGLPYAPGMACAALLLFQISPWANALSA